MLKVAIASLFTKNKRFATASKINGGAGYKLDGMLAYI